MAVTFIGGLYIGGWVGEVWGGAGRGGSVVILVRQSTKSTFGANKRLLALVSQ